MKRISFKRKIQAYYLRDGLLMLAVCLFLVSVNLAQAADMRIAFMSTRIDQENGEIFVMNPDGQTVRRLTKHPQYDASPAWSPDRQKITFMSFRDEHERQGRVGITGDIWVMNPDGTNPINLTQSPERWDRSPSWSPDGKQIIFGSAGFFKGVVRSDIWVMDADGGNRRNLTNDDAIDVNPDWSPDGKRIAFSSNRAGDWKKDFEGRWEIFVMNSDGTNLTNLTNHPARDGGAAWSPDGKQIAFSSNRDEDGEKDPDANKDIYVMNADGTNPINLTNHPARDSGPAWSPDGKQIAFSSNREGRHWELDPSENWEVFVMNADGTNLINLTNHPAWDSGPAWEPAPNLSVSPKGRLATLWGKVKSSNTYDGR